MTDFIFSGDKPDGDYTVVLRGSAGVMAYRTVDIFDTEVILQFSSAETYALARSVLRVWAVDYIRENCLVLTFSNTDVMDNTREALRFVHDQSDGEVEVNPTLRPELASFIRVMMANYKFRRRPPVDEIVAQFTADLRDQMEA